MLGKLPKMLPTVGAGCPELSRLAWEQPMAVGTEA
jgi:hypothetical protein